MSVDSVYLMLLNSLLPHYTQQSKISIDTNVFNFGCYGKYLISKKHICNV